MSASKELPKYKCHKEVWALEISAIEFNEDGSAKISPVNKEYAVFETKPGFREKFKGEETDLGYFIIYEGGYQSWSPTNAFKDGYRLID